MAAPRRTQKQIAERYKGNLGYYKRLHPWRRARLWASLVAIFAGIAGIVLFQMRGRETFFNAGEISQPHASFAADCAKCHDRSIRTGAAPTFAKARQVVKDRFRGEIDFGAIDKKCATCHTHHTIHEPNVVQERSCSACHQEHRGLDSLRLVASSQCGSCHNNAEKMTAAEQKGLQLQWSNFDRHPQPPGRVTFRVPRPPRGYTQVFPSFWQGHPEFQLNIEQAKNQANVRDPDSLRFNHQRHFAPDIPLVNGRKIDCNYCHQPDADGRYMQRVTFAANCQSCHSLQFDPKNPELVLPHGNAAAVRAFLRTLPTQYAELAAKKGIIQPKQIQEFVGKQVAQLRDRVRSGEALEREVFFATDPYKPQRGAAAGMRASYSGCAFCHEVKAVSNATPLVTRPVLVDRWMPQAKFDHARHRTNPSTQQPLDCRSCHSALKSSNTSDILMPVKANCVSCHSPQGKVVAECITCHSYHAPPAVTAQLETAAANAR